MFTRIFSDAVVQGVDSGDGDLVHLTGVIMENSVDQTQPQSATKTAVNKVSVKKAIDLGRSGITDGKTKVDVVRIMYPFIIDEPPEVIWAAFVDGAGLTEKGAVTYWYNVRRDVKKGKLKISVNPEVDQAG